jgi:hypothetical protein
MQFSGRAGHFTQRAYFFTDYEHQRVVSLRITGRIAAPSIDVKSAQRP